jgi:hypothetical protein
VEDEIIIMNNLQPNIITVKELLETANLQIPNYQRPYKWNEKHVNHLIDDILFHKDKSAYRLGTLVIHEEDGSLNIVDGQQRTITLTLIIYALIEDHKLDNIKGFSNFETNLVKLPFSNDISKANIQKNYKVIKRRIGEFDENAILFFLNDCNLVKICLTDISEAFQFFDSQNARGIDLEPHDLLKAFHLREMNDSSTEDDRLKTVKNWEKMDKDKLSELFSEYLYRIRNWSRGYSAKYFTKDDVDIFKGVSPEIQEDYPFARLFRIAHYYTEDYNQSHHSKINNHLDYPFQLDQTIINGKRFFEMVAYYDELINNVEDFTKYPIMEIIKKYPGSHRTGDKHIRNLFYCGLIYYIDKFVNKDFSKVDEKELSKVIDKIFIWAYALRLKLYSVGLESVDNYALNKAHSQVQLFKEIRESIRPHDIFNINLEVLQQVQIKREEMTEIMTLFKEMKYYE